MSYLFVEMLFIKSKIIFISILYITEKPYTCLIYTFVESFLFLVISQLYKSKNLKDFNEIVK